MGLYQDLQDDIKEALQNDLSDSYKTVKVTKFTTGSYDTSTGQVSSTETTRDCQCVIAKEQDGDNLDQPDSVSGIVFLVLDSDKPFDFEHEQKILYSGRNYKIKGIDTDPVKATWILSCINWN